MKRRWAVSLAIFAMAAATYVWLRDGDRSVRLKDGSVLSVAGIRYGQTNEFVQGTFVQRTFGRFLPRGGITLFGLKLAPPHRTVVPRVGPQMDIMFRLENVNDPQHPLLRRNLYQRSRLLLVADDGFAYYGQIGTFSKFGNTYYGFGSATAFPRPGKNMRIRVELMEGSDWAKQIPGTWSSFGEVRIRSPVEGQSESWTADPAPATRKAGDLQVTMGEVWVGPTPTNFAIVRPDLCATVPFQIRVSGQVSTHWRAYDIVLRDSDGNFLAQSGGLLSITNGWRNYASWGVLDPRRVWKVRAEFARESGFSGNELCSLQFWFPLPLRTNFQGVPMRAEFKDIDKLVVQLEDAPENRRLTFVSGQDSKGNPLPRSTVSRVQQEFQLSPNVLQAGGFITATFAVHKNIPVEFFTQPKLSKPLGMSGRAEANKNSDSP